MLAILICMWGINSNVYIKLGKYLTGRLNENKLQGNDRTGTFKFDG